MAEETFRVRVHSSNYTEPHVGDRIVDEERGSLVVMQVMRDHDWWEITYIRDDPE